MKITASTLSLGALFLASAATAVMPDDPTKIDTCTKPGVVALTFDDGPGMYNDQLLALLAKKNVKATFFVLGSMIDANPQQAGALKKIIAAGHQLASHTYSHKNLDAMTEDAMKLEISRTSDTMFKNAGVRPAYMRAPEGRCAALCTKVMESLGLVISHWNVDTNDWRFKDLAPNVAADKSLEEINKVVIQGSDPATDSFILLEHEIHKFSVDLVAERVIDSITAKGYKFVTMEECVGKPSYLDGSVIQPTTSAPVTSTPAPTVPPTTVPSSSATTAAPQKTSSAAVGTPTTGTGNKSADSGASLVRAGAWAMGLAAAVGFAML